jgi:type IV pilus assembly protein PilE
MKRREQGFSLIEMMIVVAVIAIILAIAVPGYQEYVRRANRSEAKNLLLRIAAEQEKFFTTFNRYSANIAGARTGNPATSGLNLANNTQQNAGDTAFYNVTIVVPANGLSYTLNAGPDGAFQSADECGELTLDNAGVRDALGPSAPANCW